MPGKGGPKQEGSRRPLVRGGAAQQAVKEQAAYLYRLTTIHRRCSAYVDWRALAAGDTPEPPTPTHHHEDAAVAAWGAYEPTLWERLKGEAARQRDARLARLDAARAADAEVHAAAMRQYEETLAHSVQRQQLARRVLAGDRAAYAEAVDAYHPFDDIRAIGTMVTWQMPPGNPVQVIVETHRASVVPVDALRLSRGGYLVREAMPADARHLLFQDYVCSAVLRVAREMLALLPVRRVLVTAVDGVLNTTTGHHDAQALLSVVIPRDALSRLNMDRIDPSDAMSNFTHRMNFNVAHGFRPVRPLKPEDLS